MYHATVPFLWALSPSMGMGPLVSIHSSLFSGVAYSISRTLVISANLHAAGWWRWGMGVLHCSIFPVGVAFLCHRLIPFSLESCSARITTVPALYSTVVGLPRLVDRRKTATG